MQIGFVIVLLVTLSVHTYTKFVFFFISIFHNDILFKTAVHNNCQVSFIPFPWEGAAVDDKLWRMIVKSAKILWI